MNKIIGRENEQKLLKRALEADTSEFIAIYGRRRIGKTYLISQYFRQFDDALFFHVTGIKDAPYSQQIKQFSVETGSKFYDNAVLQTPENWLAAFEQLTKAINKIPKKQKVILFLDEFPWMATQKSGLLQAVDYYWNRFWWSEGNIKLIICGSSASWIIKNIVNNKGGLHNRITQTIELSPFTLKEAKEYLEYLGVRLSNRQIMQLYMVTGGIPHYLKQVQKGLSANQNIDLLCFHKNGLLLKEFDNLYASLFDGANIHQKLIRIIANHRYGISQVDLFKKCEDITRGGRAVQKLKELEQTGFIISFIPYGHRQRGIYYKVIDEYSLFYLHWIEPMQQTIAKQNLSHRYWESKSTQPSWKIWAGYAFEAVCYKHIGNIEKALHIPKGSEIGTWKYIPRTRTKDGAQIDLLFDRLDDSITICEIKYTNQPFAIDKAYAQQLLKKQSIYQRETRTTKNIFIAMITLSGLKATMYSEELVAGQVILEDFFKE
ncbi:MAG: ATP-binding protein [Pseudomonadota bacterium]